MNDLDTYPFRVLSLCSGVGMLDLGVRLAVPGARTICYVEREVPAVATLAARMADGVLDPAPVWLDLANFDGRPWRGAVDCVVAGFPCQPWSVAGQKRGTDDARWLWDDIGRIIGDVRPSYVFLENVPGIVSGGGLRHVLGTLAELGFAAEWDLFSAAEAGAPHERSRWFCLAYSESAVRGSIEPGVRRDERDHAYREATGDSACEGICSELAHAAQFGERKSDHAECAVAREESRVHIGRGSLWPPGPHDRAAWAAVLRDDPDLAPATESPVRGVADGRARRLHDMDRLHALGNGCVPVVAAAAFRTLLRRLRGG